MCIALSLGALTVVFKDGSTTSTKGCLMRITKRWTNFILMGMQMHDMIELDTTYYVCVPYYLPDVEAIESIELSGCDRYTLEDLEKQKGSHPNLQKMWQAVSVWNASCECGGRAAGTSHSTWCPAYE